MFGQVSCHPSIVIWASGNEIGGAALFANFGMEMVRAHDGSRALWPASPLQVIFELYSSRAIAFGS